MRQRTSQRGFTLVELMVSLTLFSFAIAGVLAVAVSMAQGYREQRQVVQTESTARAALDYIADALRMTSPAIPNADVTASNAAPVYPIPHLAVGDIEDLETDAGGCQRGAVRVFNNTGLGGSDELEIVYASGATVTSVGASGYATGAGTMQITDTSNLAPGDLILVTNGTQGHITKIATIPAAGSVTLTSVGCTIGTPTTYTQGDLVLRVMRARFYIGTFDGISPTLLLDPDSDTAGNVEPLADYVEDMQIAAGIDEDQDGTIDIDEWAYSGVTGTPTAFTLTRDLRAIRVTLISRAASALPGTPASFRREAIEDHAQALTLDTFRRRTLTSTVEIRNFTGSP